MSIACRFIPSWQNRQLFSFSYKKIYLIWNPLLISLKMACFQRNLFSDNHPRELFLQKPLLKMLFQHNISFLYDLLSTPFAPFVLQHFEIFCSNIISFLPKIYFTVVSYNTNPLVLKYISRSHLLPVMQTKCPWR